jgi:hypothetical protein
MLHSTFITMRVGTYRKRPSSIWTRGPSQPWGSSELGSQPKVGCLTDCPPSYLVIGVSDWCDAAFHIHHNDYGKLQKETQLHLDTGALPTMGEQ